MDDIRPQDLLREIMHMFIHRSKDRAGMEYDAVQQLAGEMVDTIRRQLQSAADDMPVALFTFKVYQDLHQQGYGTKERLPQGPSSGPPFLDRIVLTALLDGAPTPMGKLLAFDAAIRCQAERKQGDDDPRAVSQMFFDALKAQREMAPLPAQLVVETPPAEPAMRDVMTLRYYSPVGAYHKQLQTVAGGVAKQSMTTLLRTLTPAALGISLPSQLRDRGQGRKHLRHAGAYDRLITMLRMIVSVGFKAERSKDKRIFDLALHNFGLDRISDFVIKGALVELLYPEAKTNIKVADVPFETLIHHPIVKKALWAHPSMQFYPNATWLCPPGYKEWGFYHLSDDTLANMCIHRWDGTTPLVDHLERLFQPRKFQGADVKFACRMPLLIPVLLERSLEVTGKTFDDYRSFILTAPMYPKLVPGKEVDVDLASRYYHICMVINLRRSTVHMYHRNTEPVDIVPNLVGPTEKDGGPRDTWSITDRNSDKYLLLYRKIMHRKGEPYAPPVKGLPEFVASSGSNEQMVVCKDVMEWSVKNM